MAQLDQKAVYAIGQVDGFGASLTDASTLSVHESNIGEPENRHGDIGNLPRDLQRIWLGATRLIPAEDVVNIATELAPLLASFNEARRNLAFDIAHETRANAMSQKAQRLANGGLIGPGDAGAVDLLNVLDDQNPSDQTVLQLADDLPPLLTDPQQTLIVAVLRAAFDSAPLLLNQLISNAPCLVIDVPAGIDVKSVSRVLPVLLYGPDAPSIGLSEFLQARVKPRCYVHSIAEETDSYNGRSNGLLSCIRSNLLRAADFAVPVLVVKAADIDTPEPISAVLSGQLNLPSLTSEMIDDVIAIYANSGLVEAGLPGNSVSSCVATQSANLRLNAHPKDLAAVGSFALGAMIRRGGVVAETVERIRSKLSAQANARIEADEAEAAESAGGNSTSEKVKSNQKVVGQGSGVSAKTVGANNQSSRSTGGSLGQSAIGDLNVPVFSPTDLNDPAIPRLEDLAGYGPAAIWGRDLAKDIADYRDGIISWNEIDRGLVLTGPPGVGKTLFAKSLAKTAGIAFFASSFARWESKKGSHQGDVIKTLTEHFAAALQLAPCIMLIDEIDTLPDREQLDERSRSWWVGIVNAVLEQLDGSLAREGVIVIGACNDAARLDSALIRSGRLEKIIAIPYPSASDLAHIFRFHLKQDLPGFDPIGMAESLIGFTGADVESAVRAARRKARREKRAMSEHDLDHSLFSDTAGNDMAGDDVIGKNADNFARSPNGKDISHDDSHKRASNDPLWRTAVHEAGHAIAATALNLDPVDFISIRKRAGSGGFVRLATKSNASINNATRKSILANVTMSLAGRAAEIIILGEPSTGSGGPKHSDLATASLMLIQAHTQYGLGRHGNLIWHPSFDLAKNIADRSNNGISNTNNLRPEALAACIEADLQDQHARAEAIISANAVLVTELAEVLIAAKIMNGEVFEKTFAERVERETPTVKSDTEIR